MAVVSAVSNLIMAALAYADAGPDPQSVKGQLVLATGTVTNDATDSAASMYELARIPSNALLHEGTFFDVENWGFAQVVIGTRDDTDALVDQTKATENIVTPIAQGDASHGLQLWQILGMASDPGGVISLWAHAEAAATGAGSMPFRVAYIVA